MATVTVEVNGRPYAIGCADGQEERVRGLALAFDARVRRVAGDVGQVGDARLFLMAALLLGDELQEATGSDAARPDPGEPGLAETLNAVAARIERLARDL